MKPQRPRWERYPLGRGFSAAVWRRTWPLYGWAISTDIYEEHTCLLRAPSMLVARRACQRASAKAACAEAPTKPRYAPSGGRWIDLAILGALGAAYVCAMLAFYWPGAAIICCTVALGAATILHVRRADFVLDPTYVCSVRGCQRPAAAHFVDGGVDSAQPIRLCAGHHATIARCVRRWR